MSKSAEISYVARMPSILGVPVSEVTAYLMRKPFSDQSRAAYILDLGQVLRLLPPPPARILDLGVGSGWTSDLLARCGYAVVGMDIAPDMIAMAQTRITDGLDLSFVVSDYEEMPWSDEFDAIFIYDALHHAQDELLVLRQAHRALKEGGMLVTVEPGAGHSTSAEALDAIARFGTTEKDMPFARQQEVMRAAGFSTIRQYLRISQLPLEPVNTPDGSELQAAHFSALSAITSNGHTSVVVAIKGVTARTD